MMQSSTSLADETNRAQSAGLKSNDNIYDEGHEVELILRPVEDELNS